MDRTRLFTVGAVLGGVALFALAATGAIGLGLLPLAVFVVVVAFIALRMQRSGGGLDAAWSRERPTPLRVAPDDPHHFIPATVPARGSVSRALAVVESKHLAVNPWFVVGIGFWLIVILALGVVWPHDVEWSWWELFSVLLALAHPFVGCSIVAVHRCVTRARRDHTDELFTSCPATDDGRTRGFLLTAWVPLIACWTAAGTLVALIAIRNPNMFGPIDRRVAVDLVLLTLLPIGGTALGVALGRWLPWALTPIIAVGAIAFVDSVLANLGESSLETTRALVTWVYSGPFDYVFLDPPVWERVAWLGGLTVVVGAAALMKGAHSRRVPAVMAMGVAAALVAAVSLARPLPDAQAAALASMVSDPAAHQTCVQASEQVEVCVYSEYAEHGRRMAAELVPVAAAMPASWGDGSVTLRQRFDSNPSDLPPAARRHLPDGFQNSEATDLFAGFSNHPSAIRAGRFRLAAHVVGLPSDPVYPGVSVAGQARGIVALWLSVRGLSGADADRALTPELDSHEASTTAMQGSVWPGLCHGEEQAVVWSRQDLQAAKALLGVPEAEVASTIDSNWAHWIDPMTTTDELLAAFDLDPVGPPDDVDPSEADRCV